MISKEDYINKIKEIGTCEDAVQRRTLLTEIQDSYSEVFDENETNKTTIDSLNTTITKNNEDLDKLRETNMQLFLRVGETKDPSQVQTGSTGVTDPEPNKRKFEDLFNEEN